MSLTDTGDRVTGRGFEDPLSADLGPQDDTGRSVDCPSDDRSIFSLGSGLECLENLFCHFGDDGDDTLSFVSDVERFDTEKLAGILDTVSDGDVLFVDVKLAL